jgi:hypothetical protein
VWWIQFGRFLSTLLVLSIKPRVLRVLGKHSTTWAKLWAPFCFVFCFWDGVSLTLLRLTSNSQSSCLWFPCSWDWIAGVHHHIPVSLLVFYWRFWCLCISEILTDRIAFLVVCMDLFFLLLLFYYFYIYLHVYTLFVPHPPASS